jgi:glycine cleavage system H protein
MSELKFSKDHEWIRIEEDSGVVGISNYAQEQLGDVVFVELPEVGKALTKNAEAAVVESVKAASEVYAPVSGSVTENNASLNNNPGSVNSDPLGEGWFFKLSIKDTSELDDLLDEAAYEAYLKELD